MAQLASNRAASQPLSRGEKRLFAGCAALLLLIVGGALFLKARDTPPTITFPTPAPLPKPNGYDLYLGAGQTIAAAWPGVTTDPVDDATLLSLNAAGRAARYSIARRRAWLQASAGGFAQFERALRTPTRFHGARVYPNLTISENNRDWATLRQMARENVKRVNTLKMERRWNQAVQTGLDTVQMGCDIARGAPLLPKLVGTAVIAVGRSSIEAFDDLPGHLSAREARTATTRLEKLIAQTPPVADAMSGERWEALANFLKAAQKPEWRALGDQNPSPPPSGELEPWPRRLAARLLSKREIARRIDRFFDAAPAKLRQPYSQLPRTPDASLDILTQQFVPDLERISQNQAREWVGLRLLLLRFALQAFKAEHGTYPISLSALAPAYLRRVPTDYYADDKPFSYARQGKTYKLWSVGPDAVNDGGKAIAGTNAPYPGAIRHPASVMFDAKGDWVSGLNR